MVGRSYTFDDGKYSVFVCDQSYTVRAQRYREPWRDLTGDNLIWHMLERIDFLEMHIKTLEEKVNDNRPF